MSKKRQYSWVPDTPDFRDYSFKSTKKVANLPTEMDLRSQYSLIYDQGQLGSCTANAIAMATDFTRIKEGLQPIQPSRLFIYYNERKMEGTIPQDAGAQIRDGIKSVATSGVCPETDWPYVISKFTSKPSKKSYADASKNLVKQYQRIDNTQLNDLKACLAAGYTFVYGFSVYESFESDKTAQTGIVTMPKKTEKLLGGHAVTACGYSDSKKAVLTRNSWGSKWGLQGHFWIPYTYLTNTNLADDFWTIRLM